MARDMTEIRRDIALSRERLRETAEAIGWKADVPSRARDLVHEARSVLQSRRTPAEAASNGSDGPGLGDRLNAAKDAVTGAVGTAKENVAGAAGAVGEKLSSARETASGEAGHVGERLSSASGSAQNALPAREDVAEGVRRIARTAQANPAGLAIGGLALGIAGALLLPPTRLEEERLAPVAGDLVQRGAEAGTEAIEHGGERVAEAVARDRAAAGGHDEGRRRCAPWCGMARRTSGSTRCPTRCSRRTPTRSSRSRPRRSAGRTSTCTRSSGP